MSRNTKFTLASVAAASLVFVPTLLVAPAYAATIDVAGATFSFDNPVDVDLGDSAEINDPFNYTNVATVGGVQIDAVVTLIDASSNSMGNVYYETLTQNDIDGLNVTSSESVDAPGCYTNTAYVEQDPFYDMTLFAPSDLLPGSQIEILDEYDSDPADDVAIKSSVDLCDFADTTNGYVSIRVDFKVAGNPVTLNNLAIFADDIDGLQYLTLFDPKPTTFEVSPESELEIVELSDRVSFNSPDIGSSRDDPTALNFVGEAQYDGVASISYTFGILDSSGGSLDMRFASFFNPDAAPEGKLAKTGIDLAPAGIAGLAVLGLGSAIVVARRILRSHA